MAALAGHPIEDTSLSSDCHSKIQLRIRCDGLTSKDLLSESDPFAVVLINDIEVGRTEVIKNTKNPHFVKAFDLDYFFEEVQNVVVRVYDEDKPNSLRLRDHDFLGEARFTLGSLMSSSGQTISAAMRGASDVKGALTASAEELAACNDHLRFRIKGVKLSNKEGFFGTSDPFFEIARIREDGQWVAVYRSPFIPNSLNPTWPQADLSMTTLANGDYDRPLRITVYDHERSGKHVLMGSCDCSPRTLLDKQPLELTETKKGKTKRTGTLQIMSCEGYHRVSFLDYIKGGWELNMVVGIDFTGSNGDPKSPGTLHYMDPQGAPNAYQSVLKSLADVLQQYDHDQQYPVFGFGGRGPDRRVSHCFPLNGDATNPYVHGVEGIIGAYKKALTKFGLSGPTIFSHIINAAMAMSSRHVQNNERAYTLLLIITDGIINDQDQTISALVNASKLPMSVLIVGVGDADFSNMRRLDGDEARLSDTRGNLAERDIVQFVKFNDFKLAPPGRLAKETLYELPGQMLQYFNARKIQPDLPTTMHAGDGELVGPHEVRAEVVDKKRIAELAALGKTVLMGALNE